VNTISLDYLEQELELYKHNPLYIVKIDAEGHEIDVLEGAQSILYKTLILMVETSYNRFHKVLKLLPKTIYNNELLFQHYKHLIYS